MENEILRKKYDRLLDLARKVRGHQKEYFKYRSSETLKRCKIFEQQLDALLKDEVAEIKSNQQELF